MNPIENLYGSLYNWDSLASKFLNYSNTLSETPIKEINYVRQECRKNGQGYYGALVSAVSAGINKTPLSLDMVLNWRKLIVEEMAKHHAIAKEEIDIRPNEEEVKSLLERIQTALAAVHDHSSTVNMISLISEISCEIESKKLFAPVQRRVSHLFMNYIVSYFRNPLIVFTDKDKEGYLCSISSDLKRKILLSEKVREAVFFEGQVLYKVGGKYANEWYKAPDSESKRDLTIEWHELFKAVNRWKEQLTKESL